MSSQSTCSARALAQTSCPMSPGRITSFGSRSHRTVRSPVRASTSTIANRVGESTCCAALTSTPSLVRLASPRRADLIGSEAPDVSRAPPQPRAADHRRGDLSAGQPGELLDAVLGVAAGEAVEDGEQVHAVLPQPDDVEGARAVGRAAKTGSARAVMLAPVGSDMPVAKLADVRRRALADRAESPQGHRPLPSALDAWRAGSFVIGTRHDRFADATASTILRLTAIRPWDRMASRQWAAEQMVAPCRRPRNVGIVAW